MKKHSLLLIGLTALIAAPASAIALWSDQTEVIEAADGNKPDLPTWGADDERLDALKKRLGFTGEIVPMPALSPVEIWPRPTRAKT